MFILLKCKKNPFKMIKFYWLLGRKMVGGIIKDKEYLNKMSKYLAYYYGDSSFLDKNKLFNIINFYLTFPVYFKWYEKIEWDMYLTIINMDKIHRKFYRDNILNKHIVDKYLDLYFKIDLYSLYQ